MNDEALDALADALLERIVKKLDERDKPLLPPRVVEDDWPDYDEYGGVEPEPVRNPSFPRPPRAQTPAPARGVEPTEMIGDVVPISAPSPHTGATVGGASTRPSEDVLARWYETEKIHAQLYTVPVEDMPRVSA